MARGKHRVARGVAGALSLPEGELTGAAAITLDGTSAVSVRNHGGITRYSEKDISIAIEGTELTITGEELGITYIDAALLCVAGKIKGVYFGAAEKERGLS